MAKLSNIYKVNGIPIYEPSYKVSEEEDSLADENSGRTDDGVMRINWIRTSIKKWNLVYQGLTHQEFAYMRNLLQGKSNFTFTGLFHGSIISTSCYCSKNSGVAYSYSPSGQHNYYIDVSFNIIEH